MQKYSEHFNIPTSSAEARKIRKQENCIHSRHERIYANPAIPERFMIICTSCKKVLGSECLNSLSTTRTMKSKEIVIL